MALKKEFKLGIFVILVLVATFFVINILRGADIFGREITLKGRFDDVETLVASAPVQIRGYVAGRVNKVEYLPGEDIFLVECAIDKKFRIPVDSKMNLYSTSIMGGKGIKIEFGQSDEFASDGDELETGTDTDFITLLTRNITPLMIKVRGLLDSLQVTVSEVNGLLNKDNRDNISSSLEHLNRTLASARELSASLNGKSGDLENLITNLSLVSEKLNPIADTAAIALDNIKVTTQKLSASDIEGTVSNLGSTLEGINEAVDNLSGPLENVLNDADSLINAVKNNPKKYIKISIF